MKRLFPCGQMMSQPLSRREALQRTACGFGAVALSALLGDRAFAHPFAQNQEDNPAANPLAPKPAHYPAKVKRVVYCYMDGGPSQVDTFDPKPMLAQENGQPFKMKIEKTQFNNIGTTLASPWKFRNYGEAGIPISDLFPHVGQHADKMCVIRSMMSNFSEHTNANYFLHTGNGFQGRPSMGAWIGYGLGSECQDLPGFVVLNGGLIPPGGLDCFNSGFLPASFQGSVFNAGDYPLANIRRQEETDTQQKNKLQLLDRLDRLRLTDQAHGAMEAAIANYELAYRMQSAVPELADISGESEATQELYGIHHANKPTAIFARQCLLARRLLERGVRFIELTCPGTGHDRWDQHQNLKKGHEDNALAVDQPIGALLTDLDQRGMLADTLVIWSGEFGRTPFAQGTNGRDHNPFGFSLWMAGGGIKGGTVYGATDEFGYKAVENRTEIHDLHATMLHVLGMDHTRLTYHWSGRDMRLTDVHGRILHDVLT